MSDFASLPERDAPVAAPRPAQFSLGQLLLWMTAASAVLAAIYWMGGFAVALTGIGLIGYLPFRFGVCRLWESSLIAIGFGGMIVAALMPTCVIPREVARRSTCSNQMELRDLHVTQMATTVNSQHGQGRVQLSVVGAVPRFVEAILLVKLLLLQERQNQDTPTVHRFSVFVGDIRRWKDAMPVNAAVVYLDDVQRGVLVVSHVLQ
jgi:hypothetical protein